MGAGGFEITLPPVINSLWAVRVHNPRLKRKRTRKGCYLRRLKLKHIRTKPYTPRTNGKAERP